MKAEESPILAIVSLPFIITLKTQVDPPSNFCISDISRNSESIS